MRVRIEVIRPGKTPRVFDEGFVSDDGLCLKTSTRVPPEHVEGLSAAFQRAGLIPTGERILRVDKFGFYHEPFAIMRVHAEEGRLLGYYCDVATPIERADGLYRRTDLFLDLWVAPDGALTVLDEDEFEQALRDSLITPAQGELARLSLARMLNEARLGVFPYKYLS